MGNKRVVADSSRCIGCQTCMAACIEAHDIPGNIAAPRLRVTRTYEISAPVACHHCEDAPCAKACPTGAVSFRCGLGRGAKKAENPAGGNAAEIKTQD